MATQRSLPPHLRPAVATWTALLVPALLVAGCNDNLETYLEAKARYAACVIANCDDSNPCTDDACNKETLDCTHVPIATGNCDDGNAFTVATIFEAGKCVSGT